MFYRLFRPWLFLFIPCSLKIFFIDNRISRDVIASQK